MSEPPIAALDVCDGTSAVGESRHRIHIRWSTDRTLLSHGLKFQIETLPCGCAACRVVTLARSTW